MSSSLPEMTPLPQPRERAGIRWFAAVLLVAQLGLLVLGAIALWRIGSGWWLGAAVAGVFVLFSVAGWYFVMAPGSRWRLGLRERLVVNLLFGSGVLVVTGLANLWLPALMSLAIVVLTDSLDEGRANR